MRPAPIDYHRSTSLQLLLLRMVGKLSPMDTPQMQYIRSKSIVSACQGAQNDISPAKSPVAIEIQQKGSTIVKRISESRSLDFDIYQSGTPQRKHLHHGYRITKSR